MNYNQSEFEFIIEAYFYDFFIDDARYSENNEYSYIILSPKQGWNRKLIDSKLRNLGKVFRTVVEWDNVSKTWQINIFEKLT